MSIKIFKNLHYFRVRVLFFLVNFLGKQCKMHTLIHKNCFVLLVINQKSVQMEITKCLSWGIIE